MFLEYNSDIIRTYIIIILPLSLSSIPPVKETKKIHISTKLFPIFRTHSWFLEPLDARDGTRDKGNPQTGGSHTEKRVPQIRGWFVADATSGPGESFSGHRETRRLSRTVPGPQVRAVLQLQHGRYGDERHDAEQQGQQHQSLRYVHGWYTVASRCFAHTCAPAYLCTRARVYVYKYTGAGTRSRNRGYTYTYVYRTTKHSPDRNQYTVPLHPLLSPSPPLPPLLYHPQRCTRMVQLTHRTIMRYRNSARCPCSTRTEQDAARPPPPRQAATRTTPSSPRPRRGEIRRRTRRYVVFVSR